jgi:hypothetical protein
MVTARARGFIARTSAGDGREKAHLVAVAEDAIRLRELGIDADRNPGERYAGPAGAEVVQKLSHVGAFWQLDGSRRHSQPVFQNPKRKNPHLHHA